jgi:hypothetical protein
MDIIEKIKSNKTKILFIALIFGIVVYNFLFQKKEILAPEASMVIKIDSLYNDYLEEAEISYIDSLFTLIFYPYFYLYIVIVCILI